MDNFFGVGVKRTKWHKVTQSKTKKHKVTQSDTEYRDQTQSTINRKISAKIIYLGIPEASNLVFF